MLGQVLKQKVCVRVLSQPPSFFSGPTAGLQSSLLLQLYVSALIFALTMVGIADRKTAGIFGSL